MPNKILFVTYDLDLAGAPQVIVLLANAFRLHGWEPHVLSYFEGPLKDALLQHGIPVKIRRPAETKPGKMLSYLDMLSFVKRRRFGVIVLNTLSVYRILQFKYCLKTPMVWLIHESQREQEFKRHNGIDKRCFARADRVVFVCRATQKVYQDLEHENNFVTIYNGLDLDAVEHYRSTSDRLALRRQYGFRERDPLVVNIGSICKRKDQGTFVRAARSLLARRDEGLQFLMIGSTKPEPDYVAEIRRLIPDGRPGSIRIVEETTAVFDYYRMADILVCTSRIESMPLVILEAMAFELPIVSTNVFGIPEAVEDEKSALLAEPGDWNGIADRIERLLQDGKKAEALAGNAKKRVEEKFRLQRCVEEHIALAEEMLREKAKTTT